MQIEEAGSFRALRIGLLAAVMAVFLAGCSVFGSKAADEPAHRVIAQDGEFEIREYAAYAIVETTVEAPYDEAVRTGFGRLFKYISGENRSERTISMTAPVLAEPAGEKIAMTAPVLAQPKGGMSAGANASLAEEGNDAWTIAFVLPEGYSAASAPSPADPTVRVKDIAARKVASIRFSGRYRSEIGEGKRQSLADWLEARSIGHKGDWQFAGYNPPWTIPALRRNEILVTIE